MDRNSVIGLVLLMLLGGGYIFYTNYESQQFQEQKQLYIADSIAKAKTADSIYQALNPKDTSVALVDSNGVAISNPNFGKKEIINLSNGIVTLGVQTLGGTPQQVKLDTFKTYHKTDLFIYDDEVNKLGITLPTSTGTINTAELYYKPSQTTLADGSQQLTMTAELNPQQKVVYDYIIAPNSYTVNSNIKLIGFQNELSKANGQLDLNWNVKTARTEKSLTNERMNYQVHFGEVQEGHDYFTIKLNNTKEITEPVKWFAIRSQFFNVTLMADQQFSKASFAGNVPEEETDSTFVGTTDIKLGLPVIAANEINFGYSWIVSPNNYKLLKSFGHDMDDMIHLGLGPFTFVKYISKAIIIPLFDFLNKFISNGGLLIILMTIIIRLFLSFFSYKSFLSQAKMRVLKPQLDALREKIGDNQQQMGMEQMKLYRTAGVNPLGGCLPMLLQMPFLLSMYYFIPTVVSFRQQGFLWADDLSSYDSILNLGFKIPFYGDHVSLFTILMAATTIFLTLYNKNNTAAAGGDMANNPAIKYMPYIMPILFLGWFNEMAAALTFYYTFSNIISIVQQFLIQKFFIDEKKILQKIEANKLKPKNQTSKWQERLEQMQKMQQERMKQK